MHTNLCADGPKEVERERERERERESGGPLSPPRSCTVEGTQRGRAESLGEGRAKGRQGRQAKKDPSPPQANISIRTLKF